MDVRYTVMATALAAAGAFPARAPAQGQTLDRADLAERLGRSTVTVEVAGGAGSGFLVGEERFVVTNAHVVHTGRWTRKVYVRFGKGEKRVAKIVAYDKGHDLALLSLAGKVEAPPLPLGDSDSARVGEEVIAFGSPYGLEATLTAGIISARRDIERRGGVKLVGILQTDAPINPGNSGGPLVNLRGEVIGVNSAIVSRGGGNEGIGFAVPTRYVRELLARARGEGAAATSEELPATAPVRVWLGAEVESYDALGYRGVRLLRVVPGGPAHSAGLRGYHDTRPMSVVERGLPWTGDIILSVGGRPVRSKADLKRVLSKLAPGAKVGASVTVGPGAWRRVVRVSLTAPPAPAPPLTPTSRP